MGRLERFFIRCYMTVMEANCLEFLSLIGCKFSRGYGEGISSHQVSQSTSIYSKVRPKHLKTKEPSNDCISWHQKYSQNIKKVLFRVDDFALSIRTCGFLLYAFLCYYRESRDVQCVILGRCFHPVAILFVSMVGATPSSPWLF